MKIKELYYLGCYNDDPESIILEERETEYKEIKEFIVDMEVLQNEIQKARENKWWRLSWIRFWKWGYRGGRLICHYQEEIE